MQELMFNLKSLICIALHAWLTTHLLCKILKFLLLIYIGLKKSKLKIIRF